MNYLLILFLFLVGCGKQEIVIERDFLPHKNKFVEIFQVPVNVTIQFGDTEDYTAICIKYDDGSREVYVNKSKWPTDYYAQEEIIFHELGHCVFNRVHDDTLDGNFCPKTIMNSQTFGHDNCYKRYIFDYYEELKDPTHRHAEELVLDNQISQR
jgi:hypothetical protein